MNEKNYYLYELVQEFPTALRFLQEIGLDVLNEGHMSLEKAAAWKGIDVKELYSTLTSEYKRAQYEDSDWSQKSATTLIQYIVERFHDTHRDQFPEIYALAERVLSVHADHPQCPLGLREHIRAMFDDLYTHMMKEKKILFPLLSNHSIQMAQGPIRVMQMEHVHHTDSLQQLRHILNNFVTPSDACDAWKRLYTELERLYEDLLVHIYIENNFLFVGRHNSVIIEN